MRRLTLLITLLGILAAAPAAHAQALASLRTTVVPRSAPRATARALPTVPVHRPITGTRTVLPIVASRIVGHRSWLQVRLPGRPNSSTGWIAAAHAAVTSTPWRVVVDLSERRVRVYKGRTLARSVRAVVGAPASPTPTGSFFVEESVALPAGFAGGPVALALSARSEVYSEFEGGPGQVAIHGRDNLGGELGAAQSHGCVRIADPTWLTDRLPTGTPVQIRD